MDFKLIGSILLVVGTTIGASMLALPIATAQIGFLGSLVLLIVSWFVMVAGALLILEVNLWLPQNSNLISMAKATIGKWGQLTAWSVCLLLLYSLLCAYIAGGSDLFHNLLLIDHVDAPRWVASIAFTLLLGSVVYLGIRSVDYVNRGLMFIKLGSFILLVIFLFSFVSVEKLLMGAFNHIFSFTAITVTVNAFGFAIIVPSLRVYFASDVAKLKKIIIFGSLIPLLCYIAWDLVIMGVLPQSGNHSLIYMLNSNNSTSDLVNAISVLAHYSGIELCIKLFTSICMATSFLGVSLCLADFLADGLKLEKQGLTNLFIQSLTFVPPLILVLFFPGAFITALQYAGVYCAILLILMPALMAWRGRYHLNLAKGYRVKGGKPLLAVLILFSLIMVVRGILA